MDVGSAFSYMFDDSDWIKKLALGGLLVLIGIFTSLILVGILLFIPILGYMLETLKTIRDNPPEPSPPLPEWSDLGGMFSTGLKVIVIQLVYSLPIFIIMCPMMAVMIGASSLDLDPDVVATVSSLSSLCMAGVMPVIGILVSALIPAALIRFARDENLRSAFEFRELFRFISDNLGDYVIVFLLSMVAGTVAGFGFIFCGIGIAFTHFWAILVTAHLYGQLAKKLPMPEESFV